VFAAAFRESFVALGAEVLGALELQSSCASTSTGLAQKSAYSTRALRSTSAKATAQSSAIGLVPLIGL
jgi:hypothetical protein